MRRLVGGATIALAVLTVACSHSSQMATPAPARTVLKVENRGFNDMNVFVIPESSSSIRLGMVTGNSTSFFVLPEYVVRGLRELRFQARPIATTAGPVSQSIMVTPGDTVTLVIPPN
jgi:hypothetical protein